MSSKQEMDANAAARRSRMERSLEAVEALGRHLAGIPGTQEPGLDRRRLYDDGDWAVRTDWNPRY